MITTNKNSIFKALALSLLLFAFSVMQSGKADAQGTGQDMYLAVDVPILFTFTGNISGTSTPSGFKAALHLPWHFGVGYSSYTVEANDPKSNIITELDVTMIEGLIDFEIGPIVTTLGYGIGTVGMKPFTLSGTNFSAADADATQLSIALGWKIDAQQRWNFHLGYHMLEAEVNLQVNGADSGSKIDLGGTMISAGFTYWF